jgi:hypothetical protein
VIFDGSSADPDPDGYYGVPTQTGFDDDQCYTAMQGVDGRAPRRGRAGPDRRGAHPELAGQPAKPVKFLKSQR